MSAASDETSFYSASDHLHVNVGPFVDLSTFSLGLHAIRRRLALLQFLRNLAGVPGVHRVARLDQYLLPPKVPVPKALSLN